MYKCDGCGRIREELRIIEESHPYGEGYAIEKLTDATCEYCNGTYEECDGEEDEEV